MIFYDCVLQKMFNEFISTIHFISHPNHWIWRCQNELLNSANIFLMILQGGRQNINLLKPMIFRIYFLEQCWSFWFSPNWQIECFNEMHVIKRHLSNTRTIFDRGECLFSSNYPNVWWAFHQIPKHESKMSSIRKNKFWPTSLMNH